jgi:predicted ester cyclase
MKKTIFILTGSLLYLASCNDGSTAGGGTTVDSTAIRKEMKEERNKKTAMASIEGVEKRDVDQVLKDVTPDAVDYNNGEFPAAKGIDSIKAGLKAWLDAMGSVKGSNLVYVADGDYVLVYGDWEGKFKSDFMGMKTAGKSYKLKDVDILKFNDDGKIIEHRNVQSNAAMFSQLGIQPPKQ